ncbi:MAG: exodeoxyribonuclease VII large subunit [Ruminococcaceae bacterium]|nr:exodeoxyribonuclease VII large subunit [Oscillospiraceae bacterium]
MDNKMALTVTALNEYIKGKLEGDPLLANITVKGEISNFVNHYKTGHFYLSLKDEGGVIRAVMFRMNASKLRFVPENGMKVICRGRVSSYVKDGSVQLYIADMEPDGVGALYIAFEQLKKKLEAEGLFDPAYKKPIPKYPRRVGIITAATGAAIRDMINVSGRRFPLAELVLYPALVQGDGAPAQLIRGLEVFGGPCPVDVIILGRGGGSLEDLWAFNDEALARAIFASRVPVISAVGHETDFSISDFVADLRAPTPSAAAELALPEAGEVKRKLHNVIDRMSLVTENRIKNLRRSLDALASCPQMQSQMRLIDDRRMAILNLDREMENLMNRLLERKKSGLLQGAARLDALSPLAVMSRGYSAVFNEKGETVNQNKQLAKGDRVKIRLSDGTAKAEILEVEEWKK